MNTTNKNIIAVLIVIATCVGIYFALRFHQNAPAPLDATPQNVTLSGSFTCLPHMDTTGPQTMECAFGMKTDDGEYYAVNFGASTDAMNQFQSGAHITAEGFVVIKEALSADQWAKYNMKGIFTVTKVIDIISVTSAVNGKLNINVVCESVLSYMTFPDGASSEKFVAECKEGKHPEVIERYKAQMGLGDGKAI